ncbi:DUF5049 domain-containing protein [Anaerocolumna sp. MB42-C2]|uniref:DUF5049 domain-containing protein n=1 Tax=Anaerocolumna sp. MB42-C2 TaxID=3070997 RepID=UPI0027DF00B2|nr:DUF5049 domain-containing protein [Anaerocolumna sp. MB42-C2]WMJ87782.1 DUF5049 domain-containing protein [Anaerocolumna sp. MB42-C2]
MNEKLKEQILTIRNSGITNMFDIERVQSIANELDFYELVVYLLDHREDYSHFILTGKATEK